MQSTAQLFASIGLLAGLPPEPAPVAAVAPAAPAADGCKRCGGSGKYFVGRRAFGDCFTCSGTGKVARRVKVEDAAAPVVNDDALRAAFDRARASGLTRVKVNLGGMLVKPAKATSANAGALYVTEDGTYLGKVAGGKFLRVKDCTEAQAQKVAALISDPKAAIEASGKATGVCAICSLTLTDPVSIARGIGPQCAARWGF